MNELIYEFVWYCYYQTERNGYFVAVTNNASEIHQDPFFEHFPGIAAKVVTDHSELTADQNILCTTATSVRRSVVKGNSMPPAEVIVICDMPSSTEEYQKLVRQFARPNSHMVTFFSEQDCAIAKDLARYLTKCKQQVPQ